MTDTQPAGTAEGLDIVIRCGAIVLSARLDASPCARDVAAALPVDSEAGRFGGELFFEIPVNSRLAEDARQTVLAGDIAYWPPGRAFCIFWGPTPVGNEGEIRAASRVNIIGRVTGDPTILSAIREGEIIRVEKA